MKKTLTAAALSSVLVLGLASSALAIHATETAETPMVAKGATKVTIDGSVRERGWYESTSAAKDAAGTSAYDSRVQLGVSAKVSEEATGYIKLETGNNDSDTEKWGTGDAAGLMKGGDKNSALTILEAWVNYKPGVWGVKAGHMPLALGNKVFFDHTGSGDDAIVVYADPNAATHVGALTIKFDERTTSDGSDDIDGYVALITHKLNDNLKLGGNWTYLRGGSADATGELLNGLSMSNIGLTADGKVGAISYMADLEFQFGELIDDGVAANEVEANGWAAKLGADYDLGAGKVGLLFGYGSGDDVTDTDNDADQFVNFLTDTTYDTIIAEYRQAIPGAGWGTDALTTGGGKNSGLSNLTLMQLKGSTKVACPLTGKDLSILGTVSYMQLSEDTINGTNADGSDSFEDKVGTEVDLIATWQLTAGLNYKVEAAYLFVGDVYETKALGVGNDPDDLMFIRHGLDLKF